MPDLLPAAQTPSKPVNVLRSFSYFSLVAIAIAGIVLAVCFRYIAIESITQQSEAINLVVAETARHAVHEDIASSLVRMESTPGEAFPSSIKISIQELVKDTAVSKVKIYNRHGDVVFSTRTSEIGQHLPQNAGVIAAMNGKIASELIYRDHFNFFDGVTEEDNLIQTYLPLQIASTGQAVGAFEIYTDVSALVALSNRTQLIIVLVSMLIMYLLYVSLRAVVRRIERVVLVQHDALQARSDLLAALSTRMINTQENERQRIAAELHERVAQTISAVKLGVEDAANGFRSGRDPTSKLVAMVPSLQVAIQEVRTIALGLCPPGLNELGLIPTVRWRCREFTEKHPDISMAIDINVSDEDIPEALRAIIYRVVDDACNALSGKDETIYRALLSLNCDPQQIILKIGDDGRNDGLVVKVADPSNNYLGARERTLLSGGKFSVEHNAWGGKTMQATWLR